MVYRRSLVNSAEARHSIGIRTVDKSRVQWIRSREVFFALVQNMDGAFDNGLRQLAWDNK